METASLSEVELNCYLWILADHRYIDIVVQNVNIKHNFFTSEQSLLFSIMILL